MFALLPLALGPQGVPTEQMQILQMAMEEQHDAQVRRSQPLTPPFPGRLHCTCPR